MKTKVVLGIALAGTLALPAYMSEPVQSRIAYAQMPEPVDRNVSWAADVKPILDRACMDCHAGAARKGGFQYDTPDRFASGGGSGPVASAGNSRESLLVKSLVHFPGVEAMPRGDSPEIVTHEEIGVIRAWIDQGMKFDEPDAAVPTAE